MSLYLFSSPFQRAITELVSRICERRDGSKWRFKLFDFFNESGARYAAATGQFGDAELHQVATQLLLFGREPGHDQGHILCQVHVVGVDAGSIAGSVEVRIL